MSNLTKKVRWILLIIILVLLLMGKTAFANNITDSIKPIEYTEEYKEWLKLSEEEKKKVLQPRMFDVPSTSTNITNQLRLMRLKGNLASKYDLRNVISENMIVKNQMQTYECWAFATLASLETNLALNDYYNGNTTKIYDFSERHMEYATTRVFANELINEKGFNRKAGDGGNYTLSEVYLTNGYGAIVESEMPFENNENIINISEIQNKKVVTQVYDTIAFPSYSAYSITTEEINKIKEHIKNYGAVYAGIHGASGIGLIDCYNNETGALYCDSTIFHGMDHAVAIVGWDDNYSIENYVEDSRPKDNGAWIAKNSWGEKEEYNLDEMKQLIFTTFPSECASYGWTEASQIPTEFANEFFIDNGYTVENNKAVKNIGDNGYIYISYEDVNVYKNLWGIVKASNEINYNNIYMYNDYGSTYQITYRDSTIYLANIFDKKTSGIEYLNSVSIYAPQTCTCTVYVNSNGNSKAKEDLEKIKLKAGESETVEAGYHTLEFLNPVEINSDSFTVVIEIQSTGYSTYLNLETKVEGVPAYDPVEIETGKCFLTNSTNFQNNEWIDLSKLSEQSSNLPNGDSTIRAFTTSNLNDNSLKNIKITTPPTKTNYFEGENFDKTGMVITAEYNNGETKIIDDYNITNGTNLKDGQTNVIITYEDKSVTQTINVEKNSVTDLRITTPPNKTKYIAGQDFDKTGMVVEVKYKDGTSKEITDYTIKDGENLKNGQEYVTICYEEQEIIQNITVEPNNVEKIEIKQAPNKTKYVVGQNFDTTGMKVEATFEDGTLKEITDYIIEDGINLQKEQTTVTISYEGKTAIQEITVEEKTIISILISKMPTKTIYIQNKEELDLSGGVIKVKYNDETHEEILMTSEEVEVKGFSNEKVGEVTVNVSYMSKAAEFKITVIEEETAKSSNLSDIKAEIKNAKLYTFTDSDKKEYAVMELEVYNIIRNLNNDTYNYYYYLSPNQKEDNIQNWVKISKIENDSDKIVFTINTKDIANYGEVSNSENLYLYIKEIVTKGGDQKTIETDGIILNINDNFEIYLDGSLQTNEDDSSNKEPIKDTTTDKKPIEDTTVTDKELPDTGVEYVAIAIIICLIIAIWFYKKNKDYKEIK